MWFLLLCSKTFQAWWNLCQKKMHKMHIFYLSIQSHMMCVLGLYSVLPFLWMYWISCSLFICYDCKSQVPNLDDPDGQLCQSGWHLMMSGWSDCLWYKATFQQLVPTITITPFSLFPKMLDKYPNLSIAPQGMNSIAKSISIRLKIL